MGYFAPIYSQELTENLKRAIYLAKSKKVVLICDEHTKKYCLPKIADVPFDHIYSIHSGEENKSIQSAMDLVDFLLQHQLDKNTLLVALGGGMITDITGFVASIYKRGIGYINIPTTLLSMVDAALGAKTGIDHQGIKNCVGTFYPSLAILSDADFLKSLPKNELMSGWAEVVKHLLIENKELLPLPSQISNEVLQEWANIKHHIIKKDPHEKGIRLALNAGHTLGHAIESHFLKTQKPIAHGYAVAAGLWIEAYIAQHLLQDDWCFKQLENYIPQHFGKLTILEKEIEAIITFAKNDKKNKGNEINCSLLLKNGELKLMAVDEPLIRTAILAYTHHA